MKNYIYNLFFLLLFCVSCEQEDIVINDYTIKAEDISRIELRADHKTLVPNGINQMKFYPVVYAKKTITSYGRDDDGFYMKDLDTEYIIPEDLVPSGIIKIYDESGKEVENGVYSTSSGNAGDIRNFYAQGGNVKSELYQVTLRTVPDESYTEIVVPVIFHLILPPAKIIQNFDFSSDFLEEQLQRVSDAFNRKLTTDPNAGNAKIVFKLALYGPTGLRLKEPGKNTLTMTETEYNGMGTTSSNRPTQYLTYILGKKSSIIWDPNKYLNIWIARFATSSNVTGVSYSYRVAPPHIIHSDYALTSIPGLTMTHKDNFSVNDVTNCLQAGFMVNSLSLFIPRQIQGNNEFFLGTPMAEYFGILQTRCDRYSYLNADGDSDYCPDTYSYDYGYYPTIFKANNLDGQPENEPTRPLEYFTSYNIMDIYSVKNSLSVDQVKRLRMAIEQCPSRWCYKSNWAFTGRD